MKLTDFVSEDKIDKVGGHIHWVGLDHGVSMSRQNRETWDQEFFYS